MVLERSENMHITRVKATMLAIFFILSALFLYSCQKSGSQDDLSNPKFSIAATVTGPTPAQITEYIINKSALSNLSKLSRSVLSKHFDLPEKGIQDFSAYVSSNENNADTIVVFMLSEPKKAPKVMVSISKYISELEENFRNSNASEHQKVKNAVVREESGYILLFIGENPVVAENSFEEILQLK